MLPTFPGKHYATHFDHEYEFCKIYIVKCIFLTINDNLACSRIFVVNNNNNTNLKSS